MSPSSILDIAIGLFLVFFIVSSMASVVSEIVGMFVSRRSNTMAQFIIDMFGKDDPEARKKATDFYKSSVFDLNDIGGFLGVMATAGDKVGQWTREIFHRGSPPLPGSQKVLSISKDNFSQAVFELVSFGVGDNAEATFKSLKDIVTDAAQSPAIAGSPLSDALVSAVQHADGSVEKAAKNLESWFDGQMAQLSDYYKRRTRIVLFIVGLLLAFALNVDTLAIFYALQNNPTLREYAVQQAQNLTAAPVISGSAQGDNPEPTPEATPDTAANLSTQFDNLHSQFDTLNTQLNQLGLPIGWSQGVSMDLTTYAGASKFVGIIITAVAITLGAQFWFDVLKLLTGKSSSSGGGSSG